jgi:hypothetical protein
MVWKVTSHVDHGCCKHAVGSILSITVWLKKTQASDSVSLGGGSTGLQPKLRSKASSE